MACSPGCSFTESNLCCYESPSGALPPRWWAQSVFRVSTWVSTTPATLSSDIWRPLFGSPPWSLSPVCAPPGVSGSPHPEIPFRPLRRQMDEQPGLLSWAGRFILQKLRKQASGIARSLDDDGADDVRV